MVRRLLEQQLQIEAQESIQHAARVAVGSGSLTPEARDSVTAGWSRTANAGRRRGVVPGVPDGIRVVRAQRKVGTATD